MKRSAFILLAAGALMAMPATMARAQGDEIDDDPQLDDQYDPSTADEALPKEAEMEKAAAPVATPAPVEPAPTIAPAPAAASEPALDANYMRDRLSTLFGGELKFGVGGTDFTESRAQDVTSAGVAWDVRGVFGGDFPIGVEAAYAGSSRNISNSFAQGSGDTQLVSNGVEGDLRLGIPIRASELVDIRPFAFGGIGWQYMTMWGDGAVDEDRDEGDHIMTVPAGVGLDVGIGPLNLDVRGTYRHAVGSDLVGNAGSGFDDPNALHSYSVTGALGVEF